ncbi:MAG TPA: EAL domain-containing protein, partial [Rhodocyclaceae bacterium]|nr:EAL domain-containing protein [Rhodocyclaceae bacterium]
NFHRLGNGDILAVIKNVSERKRAADEVARSISLFNEAQRIANLGSWSYDLRTRQLEWSEQIYRIFGLDPAVSVASYEGFLLCVHPDDRAMVDRAYADSLRQRQPYDITHRLLLTDGRIRYVRERCETEFAADGTPLVSHGTVQDITDLREVEAEKALYARAFEHSGEAMVITDPQERILAVNRSFTRHTGYAASEVLGQTPRLLAAGRTSRRVYQEMWQSLLGSGFWQGEVWDRRKDGSVYPKWLNISAVRDVAGKVSHYVGSFIDTSERKATEEKIHFLAHHDPLTGLFNRSSLDSRLDQAVLSARRDKTRLAVMFIDLDRFKNINDSLGHHVGDELLRVVAHRLSACVRASDIVARLGGDEFVVVLAGLDDPMAAASVAEKIVGSLGQPYPIGNRELHTSSSLGIAVFPDDGEDPATLMKNADAAMYHAKQQGRNGYRFFSATMSADAEERLALEHELHAAIGKRELVVHYQPQVAARSGQLIGFEALVRWQHPQRGLIPPLKFIPIAEEAGLIDEIGRWVLAEACRQLAAWRADGFAAAVRMAVNLSAHQLRSPSLIDDVRQVFNDNGLGDGDLELEVTESAAMHNPEQAIERLRRLRDLGVHLAIDDFGTGYSSLAYLKLLPIHVLKLDRAFVRDIEIDDNDAAISSATISLAHSLGLQVVAEGVETPGQQDFLVARGCDFLQGYRFGKPEPAAQIERRWRAAALLPSA